MTDRDRETSDEWPDDWPGTAIQAIERLEERLEAAGQTSGDLCDNCGWRGVRAGDPCAFCEVERLRVALNETNERWERACSDVEAKVERLRAALKNQESALVSQVNEQCDAASEAENRIEAALAKANPTRYHNWRDPADLVQLVDAMVKALKGEAGEK